MPTATATGSTAHAVFRQEAEDFPPKAVAWIKSPKVRWEGPKEIPVSEIDFSNQANWKASNHPRKVDKFCRMIREGDRKPLVLAKAPGQMKLAVIDGHHRALAYKKLGRTAKAYICYVPSVKGPWSVMHDMQRASGKPQPRNVSMSNIELAKQTAQQQKQQPKQQKLPVSNTKLQQIAQLISAGANAAQIAALVAGVIPTLPLAAIAAAAGLLTRWPSLPQQGLGPGTDIAIMENELRKAAFLVNAARRLARAEHDGGRDSAAVAEEIQNETCYLSLHLQASDQRIRAGQLVDSAQQAYGELLGWYAVKGPHETPECAAADGKNFWAGQAPVIGYPGFVHMNCHCYPGKPHTDGAIMLTAGIPWSEINLAVYGPQNPAEHPHGYHGHFSPTGDMMTPAEAKWAAEGEAKWAAAWKKGELLWEKEGEAAWAKKIHDKIPDADSGAHVITTPRGTEFHKIKKSDGTYQWLGHASNGDTFVTDTRKQLHQAAHAHEIANKAAFTGNGEVKVNKAYAFGKKAAAAEPLEEWEKQLLPAEQETAPQTSFKPGDKITEVGSGKKGTVNSVGKLANSASPYVAWSEDADKSIGHVSAFDEITKTAKTAEPTDAHGTKFSIGDEVYNLETAESGVVQDINGENVAVEYDDGSVDEPLTEDLVITKQSGNTPVTSGQPIHKVGDKVVAPNGKHGTVTAVNAYKTANGYGITVKHDDGSMSQGSEKAYNSVSGAASAPAGIKIPVGMPPEAQSLVHSAKDAANDHALPAYIIQKPNGSGYTVTVHTPTVAQTALEHWAVGWHGDVTHYPGVQVDKKAYWQGLWDKGLATSAEYHAAVGDWPPTAGQFNSKDDAVNVVKQMATEQDMPFIIVEQPDKTYKVYDYGKVPGDQVHNPYVLINNAGNVTVDKTGTAPTDIDTSAPWSKYYQLKETPVENNPYAKANYAQVWYVSSNHGVDKNKTIGRLTKTKDGVYHFHSYIDAKASNAGNDVNKVMFHLMYMKKPSAWKKLYGEATPSMAAMTLKMKADPNYFDQSGFKTGDVAYIPNGKKVLVNTVKNGWATYTDTTGKTGGISVEHLTKPSYVGESAAVAAAAKSAVKPAVSEGTASIGTNLTDTQLWKDYLSQVTANGIDKDIWFVKTGPQNWVTTLDNPKFTKGSPYEGKENVWVTLKDSTSGSAYHWKPGDYTTSPEHALTAQVEKAMIPHVSAAEAAKAKAKLLENEKVSAALEKIPAQVHTDYDDIKAHYSSTATSQLTSKEKDAIHFYQGSGYSQLNDALRKQYEMGASFDPSKIAESTRNRIKLIDAAMTRYQMPHDVTVARKITNAAWLPKESIVGQAITEHGYSSTSFNQNVWSGNIKMFIRVPKGMNAIMMNAIPGSVHSNEMELLLPRGTRFVIIEDVISAGSRTLIMEALTPEGVISLARQNEWDPERLLKYGWDAQSWHLRQASTSELEAIALKLR